MHIALLAKFSVQFFIPLSSSLLKAIQGFDQLAHVSSAIIITFWLPHVYVFSQLAIQIGTLDI